MMRAVMPMRFAIVSGAAAVLALACTGDAMAQAKPQQAQPAAGSRTKTSTAGLGSFGGNDKQPINIEADKLDVFQKDGRAVYAGNVIAVRGETTMKCSQLVVFFDQNKANASGGQSTPAVGGTGDALKKLECVGPVSVVSKSEGKTQVVTGQNAIFNRVTNIVSVTGNVNLADGNNVTQCESFTYNTDSKIANCVPVKGGRVRGVFEPGSEDTKSKPKAKPAG